MKLITTYMLDANLRHKLNLLTQETFCFDFEDWVLNNYFNGDYIPYSYIECEQIIANASANIMNFQLGNTIKKYIQIGTVMTKKEYRNQHLATNLIKHIINEYKDKCDGIYLFGDINALDFYRKLGFKEINQTKYLLKKEYIRQSEIKYFNLVNKDDHQLINKYLDYVSNGVLYSYFDQINRFGLQMFYTQYFDNVYYSKELDLFIVLEKDEDTLKLQSIISKKQISLIEVISKIDIPYSNLELGFTPKKEDLNLFNSLEFDGKDDYRLFIMGESLEIIEKEHLFFPIYSHA
ncbi:MAG: GNAT family N-acetyltransferase [Bacilli bacterium]